MNGHIYVYGGKTDEANVIKDDLWYYDVKAHTWTVHPESNGPGPLEDAEAYQIQETVYLFGGEIEPITSAVTNAFWKLDINTMVWTRLEAPDPPKAREKLVLYPSPTKDKIYVAYGKHKTDVFGDVYEYNIALNEWNQANKGSVPSRRFGSAYCTNDEGSTYLVGGAYNNDKYTNDEWQFGERSNFAALQNIFKFDLNYTNVGITYLITMTTLLMVFAIAFAIGACIVRCRRRRRGGSSKLDLPMGAVEEF